MSAPARFLAVHILAGMILAAPAASWQSEEPPGYALHLPIEILGDGGFNHASGVVGGNGSFDSPYLIEGWDIVPLIGYGIRLVNTTAHVLIRNNLVHDGDNHPWGLCHGLTLDEPQCVGGLATSQVGILLENASNVRVVSNSIMGNTQALVGENLEDGWIHGNHLSAFPSNATTVGEVQLAYDKLVDILHNQTWDEGHTLLVRGMDPTGIRLTGGGPVDISDNIIDGFLADSSLGKGRAVVLDEVSWVDFDRNLVRHSDRSIETERTALVATLNRFVDTGMVFLSDGSVARLESNEFSHSSGLSICGLGTSVHVLRNAFVSSGAASDARNPFCANEYLFTSFQDNVFRDSRLDMASNGEARGNTFSGPIEGASLYAQGYAPLVRDNVFSAAKYGLLSRRSASLVEGNRFIDNVYGLFILWDTKPTLRANSILGSLNYSVFNTDVSQFSEEAPPGNMTVDAELNWWGTASGPNPDDVYGSVDYEPWLTEPP